MSGLGQNLSEHDLTARKLSARAGAEPGVFSLVCADGTSTAELVLRPDGSGTLRCGNTAQPVFTLVEGSRVWVWLGGALYQLAPETASGTGPVRPAEAALPPGGEITAPMPGVVLKLLVSEGDRVAARAPLALLESMKMQLTISAPAAGVVAELRTVAGDLVDQGAVLLRLEQE